MNSALVYNSWQQGYDADIFWYQWRKLSRLHPLGMDIFFTCDDVLTAWPKIQPTHAAMRP